MSPPPPTDPHPTSPAREDEAWLNRRERGTLFGIRFVLLLTRLMGRAVTRFFLKFLAFYFTLFAGAARRASKRWLSTVTGRPAGFWQAWRHILTFAEVTLDRIYFVQGRHRDFTIECNGAEHLSEVQARGTGAILLGAHLGSFEAMRAVSEASDLDLHILAHLDNSRMITAVLAQLNPAFHVGIIPVGNLDGVLNAREVLARGGLLALLGDRVGINDKAVEVPFFGSPARFPTGPFILAAMLACPIYLTFGLYHGGARYELICEPFSGPLTLPRGEARKAALVDVVERYARRLEFHARRVPGNWFNFHDIWQERGDASAHRDR